MSREAVILLYPYAILLGSKQKSKDVPVNVIQLYMRNVGTDPIILNFGSVVSLMLQLLYS